MRWTVGASILAGAALIALSIVFTFRWEISSVGYGYKGEGDTDTSTEIVYRLDRWTGNIEYCGQDTDKMLAEDPPDNMAVIITCPKPDRR